MVDCYVRAIRNEQPHGPYAVCGYSYGGLVSFEIAKRLEQQGERVDFVGIIGQIPHIGQLMAMTSYVDNTTSLAVYLGLASPAQKAELRKELAGLTRDEQLGRILAVARPTRLAELGLDDAGLANWAALSYRLIELEGGYEPSGTVRSLTVFYEVPPLGVADDRPWVAEDNWEWDKHAREPVHYVRVTGEHDILLESRYVEAFQAALRAELARCEGLDQPGPA
jgi:thioesterase domain-containing protein